VSWAAVVVRVRGREILVVALYLRPGEEDANLQVLQEVASTVEAYKIPFLIAADWNQIPEEVRDSGWPASIKGELVLPTNTDWTCSSGAKRMLDYVCVSKGIQEGHSGHCGSASP